jgi:hypothetical protein
MYHPLLVFDGESEHLIGALLRAGDTHANNSAVAVLKRIVGGLREITSPVCPQRRPLGE